MKEEIIRVVCHIETALEFVEDEVEPQTRQEAAAALQKVDRELQELEQSFCLGKNCSGRRNSRHCRQAERR